MANSTEPEQGLLFSDPTQIGTTCGYRGNVASKVSGITYRQLDYWATQRIVQPSLSESHGSGTRRLYSFKDLMMLAVLKRLRDVGVDLRNAAAAIGLLEQHPLNELGGLTVLADGENAYVYSDDKDILALIKTGKAVFGFSIGSLQAQLEKAVENEDYIDLSETEVSPTGRVIDELTKLRMQKKLEERAAERAALQA